MGTNKNEKGGAGREKTEAMTPQSACKEAYELYSKSKRGKEGR